MREQNIYDDPSFFDGYQKLRQNPSAANDLVEKPALFSLLPDVAAKPSSTWDADMGKIAGNFPAVGRRTWWGSIFRRKCWRSPPGRINSPTSVFCA